MNVARVSVRLRPGSNIGVAEIVSLNTEKPSLCRTVVEMSLSCTEMMARRFRLGEKTETLVVTRKDITLIVSRGTLMFHVEHSKYSLPSPSNQLAFKAIEI